jgi:hypothetical protein
LSDYGDLGNQEQDGPWACPPLDGVDDDQCAVAVHQLMDDPEASHSSLDELGASRQATPKTGGDGETESVIAPEDVADTSDEHPSPLINRS